VDLKSSISLADGGKLVLVSPLEAARAQTSQPFKDLKERNAAVIDAKTAIAKATALHKKAAAAFATESIDTKTNKAALGKAIATIEGGSIPMFFCRVPQLLGLSSSSQ